VNLAAKVQRGGFKIILRARLRDNIEKERMHSIS